MEISALYHNSRPEGELLPQEAEAFDLLERLGMDYDRVSSEPADNMEKCAAVSEVLGVPICKNLFLCNRQVRGGVSELSPLYLYQQSEAENCRCAAKAVALYRARGHGGGLVGRKGWS